MGNLNRLLAACAISLVALALFQESTLSAAELRTAENRGSLDVVLSRDVAGPQGISIAARKRASTETDEQRIYWTNQTADKIQRANLDGANLEDVLVNTVEQPFGIVFDHTAGKMYWTDRDLGKIQRANVDGSAVEDLVLAGINAEVRLALDLIAGKMYWTVRGNIRRADISGANVEDLITGLNRPTGVALDLAAGKMYWHDLPNIQRANVDGSGVEVLVTTSALKQTPVSLDLAAGKMYWAVGFLGGIPNKIQRANLDGTNVEDLVILPTVSPQLPDRITLDPADGKMYWAEVFPGAIGRANLDGSGVENVVAGSLSEPRGIALDASAGKIYWTDTGGPSGPEKIQRADVDGSNLEDLVTEGLQRPIGIALDPASAQMYWTDTGIGTIQRASFTGVGVEDLVVRAISIPEDIAIDPDAGKMYWTDRGTDRIQRANLDGSDYEILVGSGLTSPRGIALDPIARKMYWTDTGVDALSGKIQRANLDGSNIEDLIVEGLNFPRAIALDLASSQMYWAEHAMIRRAGLDGANVENLLSVNARAIAVDPVAGEMYWSIQGPLSGTGRIQRSDLNGSGVTDVVRSSAGGIHLDVAGRKIYWTLIPGKFNSSRIMRAHIDGSNIETLLPMGSNLLRGIAVDLPRLSLTGTGLAFNKQLSGFDTFVNVSATIPAVAPVGPIGSKLGAVKDVAVDPTTGLVYTIDLIPGARGQQVYVVDPATGDGTPLPHLTGIAAPGLAWGLAFDSDGNLYGGGLGVYAIDKRTGRALPLADVATVPALILGMTESPFGTGFLSTGVILVPGLPLPYVALHGADGGFAGQSVFLLVDPSGENRILCDLAFSAQGSLYGNAWGAGILLANNQTNTQSQILSVADARAVTQALTAEEIELEARRQAGRVLEKLGQIESVAGLGSDLVLIDFAILDGLPLAFMTDGAPLDAILLGLGGSVPTLGSPSTNPTRPRQSDVPVNKRGSVR